MTAPTRSRRAFLASIALVAAFVLFHGRLAEAVVTRADDVMRTGDVEGAIRLYERATQLDPSSIVAADRLAFHLALRHDRDGARRAVAVATRTLEAGGPDPSLFADRAFAELYLRRWRAAESDFARAGALAHDARFDHFAGRMALRSSDRGAARRYALLALAQDPQFVPARALLRSLK
jgi:tetratricopeptide (TPR) repeat protein